MTMTNCPGIHDDRRTAQLILRDKYNQRELIVIDILPKDGLRAGQNGITLGTGLEGLYRVPVELPIEQWAYEDGATVSELPRKKERRPKITLLTRGRSYADWERVEELLWSVLSTKWDCWLRLFRPDGSWRELRVRLLHEPPDKTDTIYGRYTRFEWEGIELLSWDPFWYSKPYRYAFTRDDQGDGTPYMTPIGGGKYQIDVPVTNPTDEYGWMEWSSGNLTNTAETWSFQDGEATTAGQPNMIPVGPLSGSNKTFWLRTDPSVPQLWVRDLGQDWAYMRSKTFTQPLRPNTPKPRTVRVELQGGVPTSRMMLTIPRRWDRPIGGELPIVAEIEGVPA
ncbi:minor tail protein [Gordonia phage Lilbeanie]|uniref:Minor tail protein n=1 Tax=Gordonia phage Lilbeanie TaxID=2794947 RepID=A0A7T1KS92_9CAUD|nr:minor tail protein [Gordonia phage Lilbeanie]QPO17107.1 minor tail protein [Gordonia phage Lilbeanie]